MTTQTIKLNLIPGGVLPVVYASQYDNQVNALVFQLYNGATTYIVPTGTAVLISGTKPDNTGFSYSAASVTGNVVYCNVTQQMTAVAGDVLCELRLRTESQIIGSLNFILRVERGALNDDSVLSDTDIPLIEQAVDIAANLADYIQTAEDSAATAVQMAATATDAATRSETINTNVEGIYDQLTDATTDATQAAAAANAAAASLSNLSATANTLAEGASATAVYDNQNKRFTFGIPRGATGASGVTTPLSGFFTMWVDPDTGNLYAAAESDMSDFFSYDSSTGNLYYLTEDGN